TRAAQPIIAWDGGRPAVVPWSPIPQQGCTSMPRFLRNRWRSLARLVLSVLTCAVLPVAASAAEPERLGPPQAATAAPAPAAVQVLSLEDCLRLALEKQP